MAIIPQNPFPRIAEDGSIITDNVPDQNQPLLESASREFPHRLVVQFNFLMPGEPASPAVILAQETLGTLAAFQTNNYFGSTGQGAACSEPVTNPTPCTGATYLELLETGIYPYGKGNCLRAQYIEVFPANANAFPDDIERGHDELLGRTGEPHRGHAAARSPSICISLGAPQQLFHAGQPDALGMTDVPDMHLSVLRQPDESYHLFISGIIGAGNDGSTGLITTGDFLTYQSGVGDPTQAQPVFGPSCPGHPGPPACRLDFDADYGGANAVFPARNGTDLLMIYHGETRTFGTTTNQHTPSFAEIGLARSSDNGLTWAREGAIVSGTDPKPAANPLTDTNGVPEPGAIVAGDYIYVLYPYFPSVLKAADLPAPPPTIQVARAPLALDGAPGTWTKFYNGSFGVEPGLGGLGSQVVPTVSGCTGPRQPWPTFSERLEEYVLLFVCNEGWFFSLSKDLVTWGPPAQFYSLPLFTKCQQNDDNLIFVTPGHPSQVIGKAGYGLYASTPQFGAASGTTCGSPPAPPAPHELWLRTFAFHESH